MITFSGCLNIEHFLFHRCVSDLMQESPMFILSMLASLWMKVIRMEESEDKNKFSQHKINVTSSKWIITPYLLLWLSPFHYKFNPADFKSEVEIAWSRQVLLSASSSPLEKCFWVWQFNFGGGWGNGFVFITKNSFQSKVAVWLPYTPFCPLGEPCHMRQMEKVITHMHGL